ncbi:hypothetical protein GCM10020331_101440 [Ectobacillus funiculus]
MVKEHYNWNYEEDFYVPEEVKEHFAGLKEAAEQKEQVWNELFAHYADVYPSLAKELTQAIDGELPEGWDAEVPVYRVGEDKLATRASSGAVLNALAKTFRNYLAVLLT